MSSILLEGPIFSVNPASPGSNVGVHGKVTNKGARKERLTISFSAQSGEDTYSFGGGEVRLEPGQAVFLGTAWAIPPQAAAGDYEVTIEAESRQGTVVSTASSLTISA